MSAKCVIICQVMACRLFDVKPLPETMLGYCQLDPWKQIAAKFESDFHYFIQENTFENVVCQYSGSETWIGIPSFHSRKCIWKCCLSIFRLFCSGGDEVNPITLQQWIFRISVMHWWKGTKVHGRHKATMATRYNTLSLRHNGRHFTDDIFKCIFLNENIWISLRISPNFCS